MVRRRLKPFWQTDLVRLYHGHILNVLPRLPAESVQCAVTSPPYWGLRDYGLPPMVWGGVDGCVHEWGEEKIVNAGRNDADRLAIGLAGGHGGGTTAPKQVATSGAFCRHCGAWRGSLGLEPDPCLYIEHLVEVFREVKRVLRSDGVAFVNLGDSYASSPPGNKTQGVSGKSTLHGVNDKSGQYRKTLSQSVQTKRNTVCGGLKPKDLCGIPWRVALALQADGWWLRSDIIWHKPNPMPEPCTDRPTKSHEYVFLLTTSARYFFDHEAVREKGEGYGRSARFRSDKYANNASFENSRDWGGTSKGGGKNLHDGSGRNIRSVWTIATQPYKGAHFATFPVKLVLPMVRAGTSERGACPTCGKAWVRVVEKEQLKRYRPNDRTARHEAGGGVNSCGNMVAGVKSTTLGWRPDCKCYGVEVIKKQPRKPSKRKGETRGERKAKRRAWRGRMQVWWRKWRRLKLVYDGLEVVPCTVLDPFVGSGTVCCVALEEGRRSVGVDQSETYLTENAVPRIEKSVKLVEERS